MMRYVHQGETIPAGYGIAWVDFAANRLACYPVPLHLVVRAARRVWYWIAGHRSGLVDERAAATAVNEAWRAGFDCGLATGRRDAMSVVSRVFAGSKQKEM